MMNNLLFWSELLSYITVPLTLLGGLYAFLVAQKKTKIQQTIEHYSNIKIKWNVEFNQIKDHVKNGLLTYPDVCENKELKEKVFAYLGSMEFFSYATHLKAYDLNFLSQVTGKKFLKEYYFFSSYIVEDNLQITSTRNTFYFEYYTLMIEIIKKRNDILVDIRKNFLKNIDENIEYAYSINSIKAHLLSVLGNNIFDDELKAKYPKLLRFKKRCLYKYKKYLI